MDKGLCACVYVKVLYLTKKWILVTLWLSYSYGQDPSWATLLFHSFIYTSVYPPTVE